MNGPRAVSAPSRMMYSVRRPREDRISGVQHDRSGRGVRAECADRAGRARDADASRRGALRLRGLLRVGSGIVRLHDGEGISAGSVGHDVLPEFGGIHGSNRFDLGKPLCYRRSALLRPPQIRDAPWQLRGMRLGYRVLRGQRETRSSACSRSAIRSLTSSMPTESRTMFSGTASSVPRTEACVMSAGTR